MSKFEFIAVLLSIIFGLGLTNLLSGMLQAFLRRELTDTRVAWSILVGNLLLVNWWLLFRWSDHVDWRFHEFLYLVIWATVHYLLAVSLYPYKFLTEFSEELQRKFILVSILAAAALDVGENYVRGNLFEPWYYLLTDFIRRDIDCIADGNSQAFGHADQRMDTGSHYVDLVGDRKERFGDLIGKSASPPEADTYTQSVNAQRTLILRDSI